MNYKTRVTRLTISPIGHPIFSDQTTNLEIEDDAGGEYVKISQQSDYKDSHSQAFYLTPDEWPAVRDAVEILLNTISIWDPLSEDG